MNLFGIDLSQHASTGFEMAKLNRPAANESDAGDPVADNPAAEPSVAAAPAAPPSRTSLSSSMMASNFVHTGKEESRYITGLKKGLAMQKSFMDQMNAVVAGYRYLVEMSGDPSYSKDAVKAVSSMVEDEVKDTNVEKLEDIREDIEEKAEEATAPESEKVLEDDVTPQEELDEALDEATEETKAEDGTLAAAAPEAGTETKTAPAEGGDKKETAAPEADNVQDTGPTESSATAPQAPSVDLIV